MNDYNTTVSNSTQSERLILVYACIHLIMPCAVAIGIVGNLLSILVFSRREMIKFCVSIFTIVLALSDILLLTTSLFNIILPDILGVLLSDQSVFWCYFHGYFDLLFATLSGYSVVCISFERWLSVWKPFDKAKYVTFKSTLITVISYTSVSVIFFSWFPLALNYNPHNPKVGERCGLSWPILYKILGTISVILTYILPFFFLGILNILIVYRLHSRKHSLTQRSMISRNTNMANTLNELSSASTSLRKRCQKQRSIDRNITFMLITVAIAFMVMSFPYQIYWFYMQIRQLSVPNKTLFTLTQTFRYLNCCCNFFLYSATSSLFRRQLREIFQCSNTSTINKKDIKTELIQRTVPLSTVTFNQTNNEDVPLEYQNFVSKKTLNKGFIQIDDTTNGHTVSFEM